MRPDTAVLRGEYGEFKSDVERRLKGHDELYTDVRHLSESLVKLGITVEQASAKLAGAIEDDSDHVVKCELCKAALNSRIDTLNAWSWKIIGAWSALVALPAIGGFVILLVQLGKGGLK